MIFNCLTIFPEMFSGFTGTSLCEKAISRALIEINTVNFRDYTEDKHNRVDAYPFGGGAGMLLMPQPLFSCFSALDERYAGKKTRSVYMSPAGRVLTQSKAAELAEYEVVNILCGHYEGVDQRVLDHLIDEEISIGDYVLTGGELPAMVLMDCIMRYVPGVLSNDESLSEESFSGGLLEYPQYTRPFSFQGMEVPEVLLSGHHKNIASWQREQALLKTLLCRPELLKDAELTGEDMKILERLKNKLDIPIEL
ncbi:tRNA (guanosine(37)-N1)-methyltransferase TrmD [Christensenella minuta]|uniref:tRNA (guanine-N(1)-)-methyltransferase n=1 Tax=Christensenella minuta TaxID=626937 RepID=A0A136Q2Y2_9FIRM|nr:tRNA (guanosine(37)-N1)-methyltransferase TrmD [Christensenella minuta]AYH39706.1 tRNA (guanosine(37)-N1)-methyltransferase TrmD [Christensenella minuta]KXK65021.1 tRNA (guanine-N(1)-)-methyltransferase [Christensenella minuta]OAQ42971.1 tRNA (guanosine(37)-N1)-methyltransferase TrmD [Christensenella minuta]